MCSEFRWITKQKLLAQNIENILIAFKDELDFFESEESAQ